jgi:hypothetical protein
MRGKQTTWLVLLALALFAFIWFFERHTPDSAERASRAAKLVPEFNPNTVRSVALTASNLTLRAVRTGNSWTLTSPVNYPAQATEIEVLLTRVGDLTTQQRITPREIKRQPNGLADYGLQPPLATLVIEQPTNRVELRLGAHAQIGDRIYLQLAGLPDVFTAGSNFFWRLPQSADPWRDPALVQLDGRAYQRVEIRATGRGFAVERDATNQLWRLTKPMSARADNAKVDHLLQQLRAWRAAQFVTDDPKVDLEPLGLQSPEVELAFGTGTNDALVVQFGRGPTNDAGLVYARRLAHTNIVLVPRPPLERLRAPFVEYRDRRLATFDLAAVDNVEVRGEDAFALRRDTNGAWRVVEPLNFAADAGIVTNLLLALAVLEVSEFVKDVVTDFSAYGLAKPSRRYALKATGTNAAGTATNVTLVSLDFGTNSGGTIFARRADEESVYAVPAGNVLHVPEALFQVRDRRIWNFAGSNVVAISIQQAGKTRKLVRDAARVWTDATTNASEVNTLAVESTLEALGDLRALSWTARGAEQKAKFGFTPARYELTLDVAAGEKLQKFTLELGGIAPSRRPYAAVQIEGEPVVFEFSASLYEHLALYLTVPAAAAK